MNTDGQRGVKRREWEERQTNEQRNRKSGKDVEREREKGDAREGGGDLLPEPVTFRFALSHIALRQIASVNSP